MESMCMKKWLCDANVAYVFQGYYRPTTKAFLEINTHTLVILPIYENMHHVLFTSSCWVLKNFPSDGPT